MMYKKINGNLNEQYMNKPFCMKIILIRTSSDWLGGSLHFHWLAARRRFVAQEHAPLRCPKRAPLQKLRLQTPPLSKSPQAPESVAIKIRDDQFHPRQKLRRSLHSWLPWNAVSVRDCAARVHRVRELRRYRYELICNRSDQRMLVWHVQPLRTNQWLIPRRLRREILTSSDPIGFSNLGATDRFAPVAMWCNNGMNDSIERSAAAERRTSHHGGNSPRLRLCDNSGSESRRSRETVLQKLPGRALRHNRLRGSPPRADARCTETSVSRVGTSIGWFAITLAIRARPPNPKPPAGALQGAFVAPKSQCGPVRCSAGSAAAKTPGTLSSQTISPKNATARD